MKNFPTTFWSEFNRFKDNIAFSATDSADAITYWVWTRDVQKLAVGLLDAGLEVGDRIGIISSDRRRFFDYTFASWLVGAVVVPVPGGRSRAESLRHLARTGCEWIVVDDETQRRELVGTDGKVPDTLHWIVLDGEGEIAGATTDTSLREQGRFRAKRGDLDKLAKVTFNIDPSTPRLILSTFEEPLYCAQFLDRTVSTMMSNLHQTFGWEDETVALQLSLGWFYGAIVGIYALLHGNTIVAGESASGIAERFLTTQPTVIVSGPSYISAVTDAWSETLQNRDHEGDLRTFGDLFRAMGATAIGAKIRKDIHDRFGKAIRTVYVVDAPVPDGVNDVFQTANVDALTMWGTPETGISHAEIDGAVRSGSVGRPVYGVAMNLKKTKTGDVGPIQIRSEAAMDGYWKVDGEAELEDGWLTLPITGSITNGFLVLDD